MGLNAISYWWHQMRKDDIFCPAALPSVWIIKDLEGWLAVVALPCRVLVLMCYDTTSCASRLRSIALPFLSLSLCLPLFIYLSRPLRVPIRLSSSLSLYCRAKLRGATAWELVKITSKAHPPPSLVWIHNISVFILLGLTALPLSPVTHVL